MAVDHRICLVRDTGWVQHPRGMRQQRSQLVKICHTGLAAKVPDSDTRVVVELRDQLFSAVLLCARSLLGP
jgi:hypothetical protein